NPYAAYADISWRHPDARPIFVHRLCVHPSRQGKGIAREIMLLTERIAQKRGFEVIRLDTFIDNARALRLYEGLGYTRVGEMTARKGRFPCFEKRIAQETEG
ncbi:MAG TPA: GNAT family N-acetyltransferase, partial [Clostridia bacterium]